MHFDLKWLPTSHMTGIYKRRDVLLGPNAEQQKQDLRCWGRRDIIKQHSPQDNITNNDTWNDWQVSLEVLIEILAFVGFSADCKKIPSYIGTGMSALE